MFENFFEELSLYDTQDPVISLLSTCLGELKVHSHKNIWIFMVDLFKTTHNGKFSLFGDCSFLCVWGFKLFLGPDLCSFAFASFENNSLWFVFQVASTAYVFEITDLSFCTRKYTSSLLETSLHCWTICWVLNVHTTMLSCLSFAFWA